MWPPEKQRQDAAREIERIKSQACCGNKVYDTRTHCCENDQVVEKVPLWVGNRPLDLFRGKNGNGWKWDFISHSFVTANDPTRTSPTKIKGFGKQPGESLGFFGSGGQIVRESNLLGNNISYIKIFVCPSVRDRMCKEGQTRDSYFILSPTLNCHGWAWQLSE